MRIFVWILCVISCILPTYAQEEVKFPSHKSKVTIPFELINNLIVVPLKINGAELNFLLDTGIEETILFSLDEQKEINFNNVEKIKLRGLGNQESTIGLRSKNNILNIGELEFKNQEILIIIDENMDFASSLGIAVNGILGYHFFKNNLVKINYERKKLYIYNQHKTDIKKVVKNFKSFPISIERNKPYVQSKITIDDEVIDAKLLVDTGNSDAIWLFHDKSDKLKIPEKYLYEFLGRGFSGEIFGKKARISHFAIDEFQFKNPIVSFPDTTSTRNVKMVEKRLGSVGGELFKRFILVFDYKNSLLYAKKNGSFNLPFNYNKSGIELHHAGLRLVKQEVYRNNEDNLIKIDLGEKKYNLEYKFELKPSYHIASIRKDSPAEKIGLKKGDVMISINGNYCHHHSLQEINNILRSKEGKLLNIQIERENKPMNFKLKLQNLL